jgi:hypothetical protein
MADSGHNPVVIDNRDESAVMTFWERVATTKWGHYISRMEERAILRAAFWAEKPTQALEIGCDGSRWSKFAFRFGMANDVH